MTDFKKGQRVIADCHLFPMWHGLRGVVIQDTIGYHGTRVRFENPPSNYDSNTEDGGYETNFNEAYLRLDNMTTEEIVNDYSID